MKHILSVAVCATSILGATAQIHLPRVFTDSMVVQQLSTLTIPGQTSPKSTITITPSWDGKPVATKADAKGQFSVSLPTPAAGGPYNITLKDGRNTLTLSDVLVGEVWLCSGQSNMQMPLKGWGKVMDYDREIQQAKRPKLRLLQVTPSTSIQPLDDPQVNMSGWRSANPQSVENFSSIGYFYGRALTDSLDIPIGIIDATWGGTPIEAWSPRDALLKENEFGEQLEYLAAVGYDTAKIQADFDKKYAEWESVAIPKSFDNTADCEWGKMPVPGLWEQSVLPEFDGVVWLKTTFTIPDDVPLKDAILSLCAVDDEDVTYINGQEVGHTEGYDTHRLYTVPGSALHHGRNEILVMVVDTNGGGGIWGDPENLTIAMGDWKQSLAGRWDYAVASDFSQLPQRPQSPMCEFAPTTLFNAMIHPCQVMPIKGVLWYQGCANVGRAEQYSRLFPAMITAWREGWNQPDMPFYFVQLAAYQQPMQLQPQSQYAALRQAQTSALTLPHVDMVTAIDLGNADDIHPKNKQEVARRLANVALNHDYGRTNLTCTAPRVTSYDCQAERAVIVFDAPVVIAGGGQGFTALDDKGHWHLANGRQISPTEIEVVTDDLSSITELRYNYADYPLGNLRSTANLPVPPFTLPQRYH
ncbi:MAG: 9-O-acetylesterase [Bacteroidales bacterium]|nr:9-O-acetylesterase [Bacteroidales bacterium]